MRHFLNNLKVTLIISLENLALTAAFHLLCITELNVGNYNQARCIEVHHIFFY